MKANLKQLYCFIGLPCSGKSTTARLMASKFGGIHISCGDIARSLITTPELQQQTAAKDLFPLEDALRAELTKQIEAAPVGPIMLDGFPRFGEQAEYLSTKYWDYDPQVIEVNAGDVRTLYMRARFRKRDERDNEFEFTQRVQLASQNLSEVHAVLSKRLIQYYTIMSSDNDYMLNQFKKIAKIKC